MPNPRSSPELRERALDLTWSLWAELGVSGWRRRHQKWGIDPEPLVVFTAWIGDSDPRLRDESLDWCITFGRYLSRARLRNLLKSGDEKSREAFGSYAATVNAHSALNWPHATKARKFSPTGRSRKEDFTEHAMLALRLRALLGVSARAETIRVLMGAHTPLTASEIASQIDYTKRNVADALESLHLAGLVSSEPHGNLIRYRLTRREIRSVVTPLPSLFPLWKSVFRVVEGLLSIDTREDAFTKAARAVEARRLIETTRADIRNAGLRQPDLTTIGEDFWDVFMDWATDIMTGLAFGEPAQAFDPDRLPSY
jgi:DNA-binding transcriptional ArsR family regulator